jgi:hypothetical protein
MNQPINGNEVCDVSEVGELTDAELDVVGGGFIGTPHLPVALLTAAYATWLWHQLNP